MKCFKTLSSHIVLISAALIGCVFMTSCDKQSNENEEIAAQVQITPVDLKLNDGNFYLNEFTDSAYFTVKDGTIQLITDEKSKMREAYHAKMVVANASGKGIRTVTTGRGSPENFEKWYEQLCQEWETPKPYMTLYHNVWEENHIAYDWALSDDYTTGMYQSMDYIDEDNFDWGEGCRFTRVED